MRTAIIIPIKTNNRRLPGKNTKLLKGKPLYEYLFSTVSELRDVDSIYVDSSDDAILNVARRWKFKTIKRPEQYNEDHVAGDDLIKRVIGDLDYEIIGQLFVTSPFVKSRTITSLINTLKDDIALDSVFGAIAHYNRFWFKNNPINHDTKKLLRTQDLEPVWEESDVYFFKKDAFARYGTRVCGNTKMVEMSKIESVDIDTEEDFQYAEYLMNSNNREVT